MSDEIVELTAEERAAAALSKLAETMPTTEQALNGEPLPTWMVSPWLAALTDPADKKFMDSILKAEKWLAEH